MRCTCGESAKCIRRHWANPERDEYRCDACKRIFLRYDMHEDPGTFSRLNLPKDRQHRPGTSTVHAEDSVQDTDERALLIGVAIVVVLVANRLLRWLGL